MRFANQGMMAESRAAIGLPVVPPAREARGRFGEFLELLRIEGPVTFVKHAIQRYAAPIYSHLYIFAFDLADAARLDSTASAIPRGINMQIFRGPEDLERAGKILTRAGVSRDTVEKRMVRGDVVAIAMAEEDPVAYGWATTEDAWIAEVKATILLRDGDIVQYDTRVMPHWRRRGLHYALSAAVLPYLSQLGYKRALAWVDALNTRSLKNQRRVGKRMAADIISLPALGVLRVRNHCADDGISLERRPSR